MDGAHLMAISNDGGASTLRDVKSVSELTSVSVEEE